MNPTSPFSLALIAIVALSLLGLPVGHAMIAGSILWLFLSGLDMGTLRDTCRPAKLGPTLRRGYSTRKHVTVTRAPSSRAARR